MKLTPERFRDVLAVTDWSTRVGSRIVALGHGWAVSFTPSLSRYDVGPRQSCSAAGATRLPDGRVLISGGWTGGTTVECFIYDGAKAKRPFAKTGNLNGRRASHTATLLADGRVLVAGGCSPTQKKTVDTAEVWTAGRWSKTEKMSAPRTAHTATLLADGSVLVVGGCGRRGGVLRAEHNLGSVETWNPRTGAWALTAELWIPRSSHTTSLLPDGRVVIAGGRNDDEASVSSVEIWDSRSGELRRAPSLNHPRSHHAALLLDDGRLLVTGGVGGRDTAELFDPASETWSVVGRLEHPRVDHHMVSGDRGEVLVIGGWDPGEATDLECYPARLAFQPLERLRPDAGR